MSVSARGRTGQSIDLQYEQTSSELESAITALIHDPKWEHIWANGSGTNQINKVWADERSISGAETLDLTGGLTDRFGNALTFSAIREIQVKSLSTTAGQELHMDGNWVWGGLMSGGGSAIQRIDPSGQFRQSSPIDGYTVTASTQDALRFTPSTGTLSYRVILLGY